jgi:hypothetical protein
MNKINSWTRADDNHIVDLYLEGNSFVDIAFLLNETTSFIKNRFIYIAKQSIINETANINVVSELFGFSKRLLKF